MLYIDRSCSWVVNLLSVGNSSLIAPWPLNGSGWLCSRPIDWNLRSIIWESNVTRKTAIFVLHIQWNVDMTIHIFLVFHWSLRFQLFLTVCPPPHFPIRGIPSWLPVFTVSIISFEVSFLKGTERAGLPSLQSSESWTSDEFWRERRLHTAAVLVLSNVLF